jgi:hypothetical protein
MFVALGHDRPGTLEGIDEGRIDSFLGHSLNHGLLVLLRVHRHRFGSIGIKEDRFFEARVAAEVFAKCCNPAGGGLRRFSMQEHTLVIVRHGYFPRRVPTQSDANGLNKSANSTRAERRAVKQEDRKLTLSEGPVLLERAIWRFLTAGEESVKLFGAFLLAPFPTCAQAVAISHPHLVVVLAPDPA